VSTIAQGGISRPGRNRIGYCSLDMAPDPPESLVESPQRELIVVVPERTLRPTSASTEAVSEALRQRKNKTQWGSNFSTNGNVNPGYSYCERIQFLRRAIGCPALVRN
jgi:hypothetical protein